MQPSPPSPSIRRVGIVFSGGPAPGANAVISAAAVSFLEDGREVFGFFHGFSELVAYHPTQHPLLQGEHYSALRLDTVRGMRNARGVLLGTSRANVAQGIDTPSDLDVPAKCRTLHNTYRALVDLGLDALITIGGDGTLRGANLLSLYQQRLPPEAPRVRIVHLPKTIDNDYRGIDFTFGYFTAVGVMSRLIENVRADAAATSSWFMVETMGRKAGWLSYGAAIAGEADLVVAYEDLVGVADGLNVLVRRIVDAMVASEGRGKSHGVVVLAEGLAELLPQDAKAAAGQTEAGALAHSAAGIAEQVSTRVAKAFAARSGTARRVKPVRLGYEARSAGPHAFDVMLGSQLGIGAYRALVEEGLDAHMVSVHGQFELAYVPFAELIDAETLTTDVRLIQKDSDFWRLARFLEARTTPPPQWGPGRGRDD